MTTLLILASLWAVYKILPYAIALFEKDRIRHDLTPQEHDPVRWKSAYLDAKIVEAEAAGLIPCGAYFTARHASVVKGPMLLYRTPDGQSTVALVSARFWGMELKKIELRTLLPDGTALLTTDGTPTPDYTGVVAKKTLYQASLAELLEHHGQRIHESGQSPRPVTAENAFPILEQIEITRGERMVQQGFGKWADPAQATLRRTWKGVTATVRANNQERGRIVKQALEKQKSRKSPPSVLHQTPRP